MFTTKSDRIIDRIINNIMIEEAYIPNRISNTKMTYDEVFEFVNDFYNGDFIASDIDYDWDIIIREIGKENEDTLRDVMNDRRKVEEEEEDYSVDNPLVDSAIYDSIMATLDWEHSQPWSEYGGCDFGALLDVSLQTLFDNGFPTLAKIPSPKRFTKEQWKGFYDQVGQVWRDYTHTEPDYSSYPFEKMIKYMDLAK